MSNMFTTMAEVEADLRYQFNIRGLEVRHPSATIRRFFNESWAALREVVALTADGAFLEGTPVANLPTVAAVTGDVYAEVDWPLDAVGVYGVRCKVNTRWYPLKRFPFAALHDYDQNATLTSFVPQKGPRAYCSRKIQEGGASGAENVGKVMIVPVPVSGVYRLWYLKAWTPLLNDTDKFSGHADWVAWARWNTIPLMMSSDHGEGGGLYELADRERKRIEARIEERAAMLESGMPLEPRDARGDGYDDSCEDW